MKNKTKETAIQFGLIGIPIIAIIAVITYSVFKKKSSKVAVDNSNSENPFVYDISEQKRVDPKLVKYLEACDKILISVNFPSSIAIPDGNNLYISGKDIISKFDLNGKEMSEFKISGSTNSIAVSDKGEIALCFENNILLMHKKGGKIFSIEKFHVDSLFTAIAIEGEFIYVADAGRRIILQFDKTGALKREIGRKNKAGRIQGFIVPSANFDVISGGDDSIWAVNPGRHQIENFTSDGRLRSSWKASVIGIEGFSGCCNPTHIALLPNGDFVTAEKNIVRVKVYDATGKFKCFVATQQQFANDAKILDIATDSEGKIYVLDSKTKGIRVFTKK